jgi:hypothetical protein
MRFQVDLKGCYEVAAPEVVDEDFGGEFVVLNLADGRYFSLRGVAASLWRDVRAGHAVDAIVAAVGRVESTLARDVAGFFAALVEAGLIRPSASAAAAQVDAVSVAELLHERAAPVFEAFDDMAELILSDPIHDVEEDIGWPVRRDV